MTTFTPLDLLKLHCANKHYHCYEGYADATYLASNDNRGYGYITLKLPKDLTFDNVYNFIVHDYRGELDDYLYRDGA